MNKLRRWPVGVVLSALCTGIALVLVLDLIPFLRGGFGWQWPYSPVFARAFLFLVPLLVYLIGAWRIRRARLGVWLAWAFFGVIALSIAALLLRNDDVLYALFANTVSPVATGNHFAAAIIPWDTGTWRDWSALMVEYEPLIAHVPLAPPALPLLYEAANRTLAGVPSLAEAMQSPLFAYQCHNYTMLSFSPAKWASSWIGILMPLWAALALFPLHAVAMRLLGSVSARRAVLLFPILPSLLAFMPTWNVLYPLFSLSAFWALERGLSGHGGQRAWLVLSGVIVGLAVFVNFAFLPLLLLFGVYTLARYFVRERGQGVPLSAPVLAGVSIGIGAALVWAVYYAATGETFWGLLSASFGRHFRLDYEYLPWVWLNFWDWVLWTGLPLAVFWLAGLAAAAAQLRRRGQQGAPVPLLAGSLLITMLILVVSNFARGETGRVWLLFTPFLLLGAVDALPRLRTGVVVLAVAQAAWCAAVLIALASIQHRMVLPPSPPPAAEVAHTADADFSGLFRLEGWGAVQSDNAITLTLNWQAETRDLRPFYFSALLVSPDGTPLSSAQVWQPRDTLFPTTCWPLDQVISDQIVLPLPDNATRGDWWISLAAFPDQRAEERLAVTTPDGSTDDQVGLGPIAVE